MICCACAALAVVACGGGSGKSNRAADSRTLATATLPATLPDPIVLGSGVVQASGAQTYVIKSGDTLAGIATRFSVSLEDLRAANPGINASGLVVGATVRLPAGTQPAPATSPTTAPPPPEPTNTPAPALPTNTPLPPEPTATPASIGQTYTVQSGDIPVAIAQKFGITVEALLAANPGLDPRGLHVGDIIIIPPKPEGG